MSAVKHVIKRLEQGPATYKDLTRASGLSVGSVGTVVSVLRALDHPLVANFVCQRRGPPPGTLCRPATTSAKALAARSALEAAWR